MNAEQLDHLQKVLRYFGEIELRHYVEMGEPAGHIYESLTQLQRYLTKARLKQAEADAKIPSAHHVSFAKITA